MDEKHSLKLHPGNSLLAIRKNLILYKKVCNANDKSDEEIDSESSEKIMIYGVSTMIDFFNSYFGVTKGKFYYFF
jgi:hypothetical protein